MKKSSGRCGYRPNVTPHASTKETVHSDPQGDGDSLLGNEKKQLAYAEAGDEVM